MKTRSFATVLILLLAMATAAHVHASALEVQPPLEATPAPTREPQATLLSQENTFAFMEQASVTDSWDALLELMRQYGLQGFASGCYADIVGDLSIGGATADVVMVLCRDGDETVYETNGYDYDIWFEPEEYDTVKEALVKRYGEPTTSEDSEEHRLVWSFQQTEVGLLRSSHGRIIMYYFLRPTTDKTKPTFPPLQTARATPAPVQAEADISSDEGGFVAFMEQASLAYSMKALTKIGARHGLTVAENEEGACLSGDLAIGTHSVLRVDAYRLEGLPGFDCSAYLGADAYNAAKVALNKRYGEPIAMWDVPHGFVWHFAEVAIILSRTDADTIEVRYSLQPFSNDFYPSFPPLLSPAAVPDPDRTPQAAMHAEASTLEFLEQALQEESWEKLMALAQRYGIAGKKSDYSYKLSGNLVVAGFTATGGSAYGFGPPKFDCNVEFKAEAYDAVLGALVDRYGDPRVIWGYGPKLAWDFSTARVSLSRYSHDDIVALHYSSSESQDASLPTFPPQQAGAPAQAPQTAQPTETTGR